MLYIQLIASSQRDYQVDLFGPVRSQCTRSKVHSRGLTLMVQEDYEALAFARQRQTTEEFKKQYSLRSGIEGTISIRYSRFLFTTVSLHWIS
jgi:hypothetical protein